MNRCLQETDIPEWMTKGKINLITKKTPKKDPRQKLQTHNVPTDYEENTNGTNYGGDLPFTNKPRTFPGGTERMLQVDQRNRKATLRLTTHL